MYLDSIKARLSIVDRTVKGYAVLFDSVDLQGEYFHKDTYFGELDEVKTIFMYNHGLDKTLNRVPIGLATKFYKDDIGIRFEGELKVLNPKLWKELQIEDNELYLDEIKDLIVKNKVGISSGAVAHTVVKTANKLDQWILGEISFTPSPAEPNMLKSTKAGKVLSQKNYDRINEAMTSLKSILEEIAGTEVKIEIEADKLPFELDIKNIEVEETNIVEVKAETTKLDTKELENYITNKLKEISNG